jgi:hypothetical protein
MRPFSKGSEVLRLLGYRALQSSRAQETAMVAANSEQHMCSG